MTWDFHSGPRSLATSFMFDAPYSAFKSQDALQHHLVTEMVQDAVENEPLLKEEGGVEFVAEQIVSLATEVAEQYFDDLRSSF